ncbi:MAG: hypothetical protein K2W96_19475 [Gemmataceae bacterium]|nr:hypothetical protein [Gemmataceae bacterium]
MPLVFRSMFADGDAPRCGADAKSLGARIGPGEDIEPDEDGAVHPGTGGMSVSPSPGCLPPHRQPKRLRRRFPDRFPDAKGSDEHVCWNNGEGSFAAGDFTGISCFGPIRRNRAGTGSSNRRER